MGQSGVQGAWKASGHSLVVVALSVLPLLLFVQACHQQEAATTQLEQLNQETQRGEEMLAQTLQEKEALVREKAALEVRLQAVERDREALSEQLLGLR